MGRVSDRAKKWVLGMAFAGIFGAAYVEHNFEENPFHRKPQPWKLENISEANYLLRNFPENLRGAKSITKYEVPGATHTIAHIKQMHYISPDNYSSQPGETITEDISGRLMLKDLFNLDIQSPKESYLETEIWQKNIALILIDLMTKKGIRQIRHEGITLEGYTRFHARAELSQRRHELSEAKFFSPEEFKRDIYWTYGSSIILCDRAGLKLLPADKGEYMDTSIPFRQNEYILEPREDNLTKLIANGNDALSVVVYGAAHDLRNNVDEHGRISLIEIEPSTEDPGKILEELFIRQ